MTKRVTSTQFPDIPIRLQIGPETTEVELTALLDTGFDGHVVLPAARAPLDVAPEGHHRWTLADGSVIWQPYFLGTLRIGEMESIPVFVTILEEETIVGLAVARHFRIVLDHGQRITVSP